MDRSKVFPTVIYFISFLIVILSTWFGYHYQIAGNVWENAPHNWADPNRVDKPVFDWFSASFRNMETAQKANAQQRTEKITHELAKSQLRFEYFSTALNIPSNSSFVIARQRLDEEATARNDLEKQRQQCTIQPGKVVMPSYILLYFIFAVMCLMTDYAIVITARNAFPGKLNMGEWISPYLCYTLLCSVFSFVALVKIDIFTANKTWILPTSFFVCHGAWIAERVAFIGITTMFGVPVTRIWCLSRREMVPDLTPESLTNPDGKCGTGAYVNFLDVWTNMAFVSFALCTVFQFKYVINAQHIFDNNYLIPILYNFILAIVFAWRLVRCALILREKYNWAVKTSFSTLKEKEESKIARDPTVDFIGERWWKIPVTLAGIFAIAWAILQWGGISNVIEHALK